MICQNQVTADNELIEKYNAFVRQCRNAARAPQRGAKIPSRPIPLNKGASTAPEKRSSSPGSQAAKQPVSKPGDELAAAKSAARKKAQGADEINQKHFDQIIEQSRQLKIEEYRQEQEEKNRKLEDERRRRELAEARRTHCFGNSDLCTRNCCARYYQLFGYDCNQGRCSSQCGVGHLQGGYCYKE
jgi:hypothetical protein